MEEKLIPFTYQLFPGLRLPTMADTPAAHTSFARVTSVVRGDGRFISFALVVHEPGAKLTVGWMSPDATRPDKDRCWEFSADAPCCVWVTWTHIL